MRPDLLPVAPFVEWLRKMERHYPGPTEMAAELGMTPRRLYGFLNGEHRYVAIGTVDRAFCAAGCPELLVLLYPLEEAA